MTVEPKILVAGAGLGGLTAALALARAGFAVEVFEQAPELGEVGAGIQIGPNAVKVLRALGLEDGLARVGVRPTAREGRDWATGAVLISAPMGDDFAAEYGAAYYHVHRADLLGLLAAAVAAEPGIAVHLGAEVAGFEQDEARVQLGLADGRTVTGDALVGADGIHSAVRAQLFGPDAPRFTGNVAFRATVPTTRLPAGMIEVKGYNWMGPHHHFVHYYLRGGQLMNCVGVCEQDDWRIESWTQEGDLDEFKREFDGWHETIRSLIGAVDQCFKWALYDRDPLARWSVGRATLLGDAAHPMLPFLAQGACMAIEDGYVLARRLTSAGGAMAGEVAGALAAYEATRRPRTAQVQLGARARGQSLHLADRDAVAKRNQASRQDPDNFARSMHWLYAHDVVAEEGPLA